MMQEQKMVVTLHEIEIREHKNTEITSLNNGLIKASTCPFLILVCRNCFLFCGKIVLAAFYAVPVG